MKTLSYGLVASLLILSHAQAQFGDPFLVEAKVRLEQQTPYLDVHYSFPPEHYLYAESVQVIPTQPVTLVPQQHPKAKLKYDQFLETNVLVYTSDFKLTYRVENMETWPIEITLEYQGCDEGTCYLPVSRKERLQPKGLTVLASPAPEPDTPPQQEAEPDATAAELRVIGKETGYLSEERFLDFLDRVESGEGMTGDRLQDALSRRGVWVVVLLILLGGLALNLTPCVLPMIPINIAIIGAGARAGSKLRGFALGTTYGLGIAVVYGALGLIVVLTGAKFGTLNASPWFNLAIAVVFALMALAMFDVISIDLSKFQGNAGSGMSKGGFFPALVFGGLAALLAGACVAPILISVLLLSADLYARGNATGLVLPFLLGVGMALPWPFAGAGLSFLPKPGKWMTIVKYALGVVVLGFVIYYGHLSVTLFKQAFDAKNAEPVVEVNHEGWYTSLDKAIEESRRTGKPLFVDFWASWCKNCVKMDKTTFKDPQVVRRLESYVRVKYIAEDLRAPDVAAQMNRYGVIGLPTYVVLKTE